MVNIKLVLEYNGIHFSGWQKQPNAITVQEELEAAICTVLKLNKIDLICSGRTDANVHALEQVANFKTEKEIDLDKLTHSINGLLKNKVSVLSAEKVGEDFHSRKSAKKKVYLYKILNRSAPATIEKDRVWHVPKKIDLNILREQAKDLIGEHDFNSFRAANCCARSSIKTISKIEILDEAPYVLIRIHGSGFLKQMVRIIVGTLVEIGINRISLDEKTIKSILEAKNREIAGITAPGYGLYLEKVLYETH